jgi:hypothetical protein
MYQTRSTPCGQLSRPTAEGRQHGVTRTAVPIIPRRAYHREAYQHPRYPASATRALELRLAEDRWFEELMQENRSLGSGY